MLRKTIQIDSKTESFIVDFKKDLPLVQTYDNLAVSVVFTEKVTGKSVEANANINIVQFSYATTITNDLDNNYYFMPNSTINFKITITKSDGTLVRIFYKYIK